jgi:hypothetical protein
MATAKTIKVQTEIDKAKAKLAEQQAKVKELEQKRTELENTEIVDTVRGMSIPLDDLAALLQSLKGGAVPAPASVTSGQVGPKRKKAEPGEPEEPDEIDDDGDEDTDEEDENE